MKRIFLKTIVFFIFGLSFFFFPSPTKAQENLVEAYSGIFADYQGVPQGNPLTTEELKVINDQDEGTFFSTSLPAQAVMLFHFGLL